MKRAKVFGSIKHFEDFINSPDVSVIDIKVQTVEQSYNFQDCFVGVVFYEDAPQNAKELAATTANTQMAAALFDLVWTTFSSKVSDTEWKSFAQSWEERLNAKDALRHL